MTFTVPNGRCPHCGGRFESGTWGDQPVHSGSAGVGAMVVCLTCAGVSELTQDRGYRPITQGEFMLMPPEKQERLTKMQQNVVLIKTKGRAN